jgi:MinD-like ATPase involved in chromosome partitioning or flagellar assembly
MRRISVLNFKGGTGKPSVVENLGHALAHIGSTVFVIDGHRQSNTTTTLLGKRMNPLLIDVLTGKVDLTDPVRTDTVVPYAQSEGMTVFEYAERYKIKSLAADDFTRPASYLLQEGK